MQLQPKIFRHTGNSVCKWTGYTSVSVYSCTMIISLEISIYLLYLMYHQLRDKPAPVWSAGQRLILEFTCLFFAMILPPCLLAIPHDYFGVSGATCWVTKYENASCTTAKEAEVLETVIFTTYVFITAVNIIAYGILVAIFWRLSRTFQQSRAQYLKSAKRTAILVSLLVMYTITHLLSIILLYFADKENIQLSGGIVTICLITPLSESLRPIAYMYYFNSIKKFLWSRVKREAEDWKLSCTECCMRAVYKLRGSEDRVNIDEEYLTPSTLTTSFYGSLLTKPEART